ncbi:MAG: triose-phosphate isomerase [Chloroflexota bacterium]
MRSPLVVGNWKMNYTVEEGRTFVYELGHPLDLVQGVEKVICPPFTMLLAIAAILEGTSIGMGAQNMHWEEKGAFTGEVSAKMVAEYCKYVIIGHSERRAFFGETDETVRRKVAASEKVGLTPIVCVGETLTEYERKETSDVITRQVEEGLRGFEPTFLKTIVVAYEPVWAIGTGRASTADNADRVIQAIIRPSIAKLYDEEIAQSIRVLYGGSVTAGNAAELFTQPDIDGALVGGASLKVDEFVNIALAAVPPS